MGNATIRAEGDRVLLLVNGKTVLNVHWKEAEIVSRAMRIKSKQAEECAKAEQIVSDNAILTRRGFPVGLTNNPALVEETKKEAAWNRDLRKYIRPMAGCASDYVAGTPSVKRHPNFEAMTREQKVKRLSEIYRSLRIN